MHAPDLTRLQPHYGEDANFLMKSVGALDYVQGSKSISAPTQ